MSRHRILCSCLVLLVALGCTLPERPSQADGNTRPYAAHAHVRPELVEPSPVGHVQQASHNQTLADFEVDQENESTLELVTVIRQAIHTNPEIRLSVENARTARAALSGARAERQPLITAGAGYGVSNLPIRAFSYRLNQGQPLSPSTISDPASEDDFNAQLQMQKDLYDGGKRAAQVRAAASLRSAAAHSICATRNQVMFRVAKAYYQLLRANRLVRVRKQAVHQVEAHLNAVRTRRAAGSAVKSDELAVLVRLAEARDAVVVAENEQEQVWALLDRVVGSPVPRRSLPGSIPAVVIEGLMTGKEPWAQASQRPEIASVGCRQSAAFNQVHAAQAGNAARVQFVGDYEVHTGDFGDGEDGFYVGMLASFDLFDGGRVDSTVAAAKSSLRRMRIECQRLRLDIEFEIRQAELNLNAAIERQSLATQSAEEAEEVLRNVEIQYRSGSATLVELLDAQVMAADTHARTAAAQVDLEIARLDLARAKGLLHTRFPHIHQDSERPAISF